MPHKVPLFVNDIKEEILWNNRLIILNAHDNVLSFQDLYDTFDFRCTFLHYGGLLAAIPKDWKNAISHGNQAHTNEQKYARLMFAEKSFCPPLVESYLREQTFTPSAEYELPFKIPIENKLRSFQFKLIHNSLPTNLRL